MLGSEAIDEVQVGLGFRTDLSSRILTTMQRGQRHLEHNWLTRPLPWFLLTERSSSATTGNEERVGIPGDFIQEYEQDGIWLVDSNGGEHLLGKYDADDLRQIQEQATGFNTITSTTIELPTHYDLIGQYWRLFPTPTEIYTLKQIYYQEDELVDSGTENLWLKYAPYVLIGWAGERLAIGGEAADIRQDFQNMKTAAISALNVQSVERRLTNRQMAMGETI